MQSHFWEVQCKAVPSLMLMLLQWSAAERVSVQPVESQKSSSSSRTTAPSCRVNCSKSHVLPPVIGLLSEFICINGCVVKSQYFTRWCYLFCTLIRYEMTVIFEVAWLLIDEKYNIINLITSCSVKGIYWCFCMFLALYLQIEYNCNCMYKLISARWKSDGGLVDRSLICFGHRCWWFSPAESVSWTETLDSLPKSKSI